MKNHLSDPSGLAVCADNETEGSATARPAPRRPKRKRAVADKAPEIMDQAETHEWQADEALGREAAAFVSRFRTSKLIEDSQRAFRRELPNLLRTHERRWVAFQGEEMLGVADHEIDLYELAEQQGLKPDQFVIRYVMPEAPAVIDVRELLDS